MFWIKPSLDKYVSLEKPTARKSLHQVIIQPNASLEKLEKVIQGRRAKFDTLQNYCWQVIE